MPTEHTFTCATCDHEIVGHPVFHIGLTFCCAGCAADGPCMCSYDVEERAPAVQLVEPAGDEIVEPVGGRIFPERRVREPLEPVGGRIFSEPRVRGPVAAPASVAAVDDAARLVHSGR